MEILETDLEKKWNLGAKTGKGQQEEEHNCKKHTAIRFAYQYLASWERIPKLLEDQMMEIQYS